MITSQNAAPNSAAPNGPRDLILLLYREIGISAVAAALETSAGKQQGLMQCRNDPVASNLPPAHERTGHWHVILTHADWHS